MMNSTEGQPSSTRRGVDRRAGRRVPASIPVTWRYRRHLDEKRDCAQAVIVDVSVSGARVMAPTSRSLQVGTVVELELRDGGKGLGVVRRCEVGGVPGRGFYGIEFGDVDDAFRGSIFRVISDAVNDENR
jgi:hypothetical protein